MFEDIDLTEFANLLNKPFIFLNKKGVVIGANDYYNSLDHKISDISEMKGSIFDSLLISSSQKENLKLGKEVSSDYVYNLSTGELSKVFPRKRLIDRLFINISFIPFLRNCEVKGYFLIIEDKTQKFNDGIDLRERMLMWKNIALLGKMAYFQYDINLDEWTFSDNWQNMFPAS